MAVTVTVSAYVDPWDMLKNFCFHVYAQILLFMTENDNALLMFPSPVSGPIIGRGSVGTGRRGSGRRKQITF